MFTDEMRGSIITTMNIALWGLENTKSRKAKIALREIVKNLNVLHSAVGPLAQRKFADGWDAAVAKMSEQSLPLEVELDAAGCIPCDYTRD